MSGAQALWPQRRLDQLWALQKRARKVDLHLTVADDHGLHLRGDDRETRLSELSEAEAIIVAAEVVRHE